MLLCSKQHWLQRSWENWDSSHTTLWLLEWASPFVAISQCCEICCWVSMWYQVPMLICFPAAIIMFVCKMYSGFFCQLFSFVEKHLFAFWNWILEKKLCLVICCSGWYSCLFHHIICPFHSAVHILSCMWTAVTQLQLCSLCSLWWILEMPVSYGQFLQCPHATVTTGWAADIALELHQLTRIQQYLSSLYLIIWIPMFWRHNLLCAADIRLCKDLIWKDRSSSDLQMHFFMYYLC